ncbi:putative endonuclease (fragment) [Sterolibacterium denitrificans]|uniref:Endonuclease n=2 Tax=Sterolibacterium denitrificans TaxID=157592 RepID=A0A7Z7MUV9_9PROT
MILTYRRKGIHRIMQAIEVAGIADAVAVCEARAAMLPLILTLDMNGAPYRWVTWQHACFYYARNLVAWSAGDENLTFYGGISRATGRRSSITTNSIIAIRGRPVASRGWLQVPPLSNRELFQRDRHVCAYCGNGYASQRLTREHIVPLSQGGLDLWMNVVTACRACNQRKSGRTPEQAGMQLLYAPYVPNKAEYLILSNRRILHDQMDFLAKHVPVRESRLLRRAC